jgi:hypothetical protein
MSAVWFCTNPLCDCGMVSDDGVGVKSFFNVEKMRVEYSPICRGCGASIGPAQPLLRGSEQRVESDKALLDVSKIQAPPINQPRKTKKKKRSQK